MEREQERDDYHARITQLENLVKDKDRKEGVTQRLKTEVRRYCRIELFALAIFTANVPCCVYVDLRLSPFYCVVL